MEPLVRDATGADAGEIGRIARTTWRATYSTLLSDAEIAAFLEAHYAPTTLLAQIEAAWGDSQAHFLVATLDREPVGYLHWEPMPDRGPYLRRLYVLPDHQGRGTGSALMDALHSRLEAGSAYELDVHPRNHRAVGFYRGYGAEWTGGRIEPCWELMRIVVPGGTSDD